MSKPLQPNLGKIIFIIGGARSGKSSFALGEASRITGKKAYIATAEALDEEMRERIEKHKRQRERNWDTYEESIRLCELIKEIGHKYEAIVIDCLTLWLSNLLHAGFSIDIEIEQFISSLRTLRTSMKTMPHQHPFSPRQIGPNAEVNGECGYFQTVCIISNEVGMGIVPENELARKFRDIAGILNQKIAEAADEVYMMVAGMPVKVK